MPDARVIPFDDGERGRLRPAVDEAVGFEAGWSAALSQLVEMVQSET